MKTTPLGRLTSLQGPKQVSWGFEPCAGSRRAQLRKSLASSSAADLGEGTPQATVGVLQFCCHSLHSGHTPSIGLYEVQRVERMPSAVCLAPAVVQCWLQVQQSDTDSHGLQNFLIGCHYSFLVAGLLLYYHEAQKYILVFQGSLNSLSF